MDVLGLVIAVVVLAANAHGNTAGIALLSEVAENADGSVSKALVDQGFKNQVGMHGADLGMDVEIVERNPRIKGFVLQPKRWWVEQTYGILILPEGDIISRTVRSMPHPASPASRDFRLDLSMVGAAAPLSSSRRDGNCRR